MPTGSPATARTSTARRGWATIRRTSVLNRWCRAHEVDNLYVVDGSPFPTGTGANPTLTIMANAWRVADKIIAERGGRAVHEQAGFDRSPGVRAHPAWHGRWRAKVRSSAPCIASRRASTIATSWWPAPFPPIAERASRSAETLGLDPARSYADFGTMALAEAARPDGIEAVAIVTPNHMHASAIRAFVDAGIHVICDKPLTTTVEEARDLQRIVQASGLFFGLTHTYTGYPMIRQAREMVRNGDLGDIRVVQVEYAQDWLATKLEDSDNKQAAWRADPNGVGALDISRRSSRVPAGHPEGYLEAFGNLYADAAEDIIARRAGRSVGEPPMATIDDGVAGLAFIEAAIRSSSRPCGQLGIGRGASRISCPARRRTAVVSTTTRVFQRSRARNPPRPEGIWSPGSFVASPRRRSTPPSGSLLEQDDFCSYHAPIHNCPQGLVVAPG